MSRKQYFGVILLEGLLLAVVSVCITVSLAEGFYIPDSWSGRTLPAILPCAAVSAYWLLVTYNRKSSLIGIFLFVILAAVVIIMIVRSGSHTQKILLYLILAAGTATAAFFVSRTRIGAALLICGGCIVICGNRFLQYGSHPAALIICTVCSAGLLIERNYRIRIRKSSTRESSIIRHTSAGILCCLVAAALAGGGAVALAQAQLPTQELKLIKELVRMPVMEKIGVSNIIPLTDEDRQTSRASDEETPAADNGEQKTETKPDTEQNKSDTKTEQNNDVNLNSGKSSGASAVSYDRFRYIRLLIPAAIAGACIAAVLIQRRRRVLRQRKFDGMDSADRIAAYYQYFLHMLSLVHLPSPASDTVREYSRKMRRRANVLFPEKSEFERISRDFERVYYGGEHLSDEEWTRIGTSYRSLPDRCRKSEGNLRYLLLFFRT